MLEMCTDAGSKQNEYIAVILGKPQLIWQPSLCTSEKSGDTMPWGLH